MTGPSAGLRQLWSTSLAEIDESIPSLVPGTDLLVLAGDAGVRVLDAASGVKRWHYLFNAKPGDGGVFSGPWTPMVGGSRGGDTGGRGAGSAGRP